MVLENRIKNQLLYLFIFSLLNVGMIFTDLPIYERTVTHSLMIFFAPLIFVFILAVRNFKKPLTKNLKLFLLYMIVSFVSSLVLLYTLGDKFRKAGRIF
jgi:type IV secretory pathway TrbL component